MSDNPLTQRPAENPATRWGQVNAAQPNRLMRNALVIPRAGPVAPSPPPVPPVPEPPSLQKVQTVGRHVATLVKHGIMQRHVAHALIHHHADAAGIGQEQRQALLEALTDQQQGGEDVGADQTGAGGAPNAGGAQNGAAPTPPGGPGAPTAA